jgi:hypothetical protein
MWSPLRESRISVTQLSGDWVVKSDVVRWSSSSVTTSVAAYWIADVLSSRGDATFVFGAVVTGVESLT